jgi:hypothetical protein
VTLQYFDGSGARCEAVGMLERTELSGGEPVLFVRKKDDSIVRVPLSRIRAGRIVEPKS